MEWTGQSLLWFCSPSSILRQHKNLWIVSGGRCDDVCLQAGELLHRTGFWAHRSADAFLQYNYLLGMQMLPVPTQTNK